MNSVEKVKALCKQRKIAISKLEKDLEFGNGYVSSLRRGTFPAERLSAIAEYFGISVENLYGDEFAMFDEQQSDAEELYSENRVLLHRIGNLKPEDKQYVKDLIARLEGGNGD